MVMHDACPTVWRDGDPIVLLAHGLGGCHDSGYSRRLAKNFYCHGARIIRLDLRGAGEGLPLARGSYNAGKSDDVRRCVEKAHSLSPTSPIVIFGVSLGGNLVLKLAGEAASDPVPGLARVVAVAPPIDLEQCSAMLSEKRNRIYENFFVKLLVEQLEQRRGYFPDLPVVTFTKPFRMREFDDRWTAPQGGFRDALDYYHQSSAFRFIPEIRLPTLILTSRDDPFIAVEPFEKVQVPRGVEMHIVNYGGHLGFLGPDGKGGYRWAESRLVEWTLAGFRSGGGSTQI